MTCSTTWSIVNSLYVSKLFVKLKQRQLEAHGRPGCAATFLLQSSSVAGRDGAWPHWL